MIYNMDDFEDLMNESEPEVWICGCKFLAGTALRKLDYTAFVMNYNEYLSLMEEF